MSGIDNSQLKPQYIRRNVDGKIIAEKTYIDSSAMDAFLQERSINLGDYFHFEYSYIEHHLNEVADAAKAAERIRINTEKSTGVVVDYSNNDELVILLAKKDAVIERLEQELANAGPNKDAGDSYTTPFLELMRAAIAALNISPKNQLKKEEITTWFLTHKIDGVKVSRNMAESMASFIRLSESRVGGNKPSK